MVISHFGYWHFFSTANTEIMEIWEVFSQYVFYLPIAARNSWCHFWWILQTIFKFYFLSFYLNNLFHYFMQIPLFLSSSVTLKDGPIFFVFLTIISVIVYLKSFSSVEDIYFSVNKWKGTQHTYIHFRLTFLRLFSNQSKFLLDCCFLSILLNRTPIHKILINYFWLANSRRSSKYDL